MRLHSGRNPHENIKPTLPGPQKAVWKTYLLADDLVHEAVSKTAGKIEKRTGMSRKKLAYAIVGTGLAVDAATECFTEPKNAIMKILINTSLFLFTKHFIDLASIKNDGNGTKAINPISNIMRMQRFFVLAGGAAFAAAGSSAEMSGKIVDALQNFGLSSRSELIGAGIGTMALGVVYYLMSDSNGTLNRIKDFAKNLIDRIIQKLSKQPVPAPQPVRIKRE